MPKVDRKWTIESRRPLHPSVIAATAQKAGWPMSWYGLVNGLSCPRGRAYGEAHFLLSDEDLEGVGDGPVDIKCEHEDGATEWVGYYRIRSEAVTKQATPAHWVVFGDRRWKLEQTAAENKRYNLRKSSTEFVDATTNGGTAYTWQEVIEDLWALLPGIAGTCPTAPGSSGTPENLQFDGISAWRAINQVLTAIGAAAVLNPFDGTFSFVSLSTATTRETVKGRLLWDFDAAELDQALPATAKVLFPALPGEATAEPYSPWHQPPFLHDGAIGGSQGEYPIVDTLFGYDDNSAARAARATAIGTALRGLLDPRTEPWGEVYAGIVDLEIHSRLTNIRWWNDGTRGTQTLAEYAHVDIDWPVPPNYDAGGAGGGIQGELTALRTESGGAYSTLKVGTITVKIAPCGQDSLLGESIEVVDWSQCVFDLDFEDLEDVWVWAIRGVGIRKDNAEVTECHWTAQDRCCVPADSA